MHGHVRYATYVLISTLQYYVFENLNKKNNSNNASRASPASQLGTLLRLARQIIKSEPMGPKILA